MINKVLAWIARRYLTEERIKMWLTSGVEGVLSVLKDKDYMSSVWEKLRAILADYFANKQSQQPHEGKD